MAQIEFSLLNSYVKRLKVMVTRVFLQLISVFCLSVLICACGVKGAPTPYVEVYPEKTQAVVEAQGSPLSSPVPAPTPVPVLNSKTKKPTSKKKR